MSIENLQTLIEHEKERALRLEFAELKRKNDTKEAILYGQNLQCHNTHGHTGCSWDCYDEDGSWLGSL